MKKLVASVGLVALGASGVQAASPSPLDSEAPKPWTLSVKLRGFYDDNYQALPSGPLPPGDHRDSWGFDVSPGVAIDLPLDQTEIKASYVYGLIYYQHRPSGNQENYDQTHNFSASLDHAFNERYQISLKDSFVIGQEPDTLRAGNTYDSFQRIPGNNIRNSGSVDFTAQLTKQLGLAAGYANNYFDYADHGATLLTSTSGAATITTVSPSFSGTLDRMEQMFHLDGRWQFRPTTVGIIGYQFSDIAYNADEVVGGAVTNAPGTPQTGQFYRSDVRNNRSHYGYLGVDQTFTARLSASMRAGGRYNDYYNDPFSQNEPSPYVQATVKYAYMAGCTAEVGATYDRSATDLFSYTPGEGFTTDSQTLSAWLAIHHRITPRLTGTLNFQYQNSDYQGGSYN